MTDRLRTSRRDVTPRAKPDATVSSCDGDGDRIKTYARARRCRVMCLVFGLQYPPAFLLCETPYAGLVVIDNLYTQQFPTAAATAAGVAARRMRRLNSNSAVRLAISVLTGWGFGPFRKAHNSTCSAKALSLS